MMYADGKLVSIPLFRISVSGNPDDRTGIYPSWSAGIRAMITAVILPGLGYALSPFNFAIAATVTAISTRHCDSLPF
jgi:hypothetical protein